MVRLRAGEVVGLKLNDIDWLRQKLKDFRVDLKSPHMASAGLGSLQLALFEVTTEAELAAQWVGAGEAGGPRVGGSVS